MKSRKITILQDKSIGMVVYQVKLAWEPITVRLSEMRFWVGLTNSVSKSLIKLDKETAMKSHSFVLYLGLILLLTACKVAPPLTREVSFGRCIQSFQQFAFAGPDLKQGGQTALLLPTPPWKEEGRLPKPPEGYFSTNAEVVIYRPTQTGGEIWIRDHQMASAFSGGYNNVFYVYTLSSKQWTTISAKIDRTKFSVERLFVTRDGRIWGNVTWDTTQTEKQNFQKVPVLSQYNEKTQRFEQANGILEIPWVQFSYGYYPWPEILLDPEDQFWIFVKEDGLYRYDVGSQKIEKQVNLPGKSVIETALSSDGSIYYEIYSEQLFSPERFFRISEGMLFHFIPSTKEVSPLKLPEERWPAFSGMRVDQKGRLWLGAIGYQEVDGKWHLIHPDPQGYLKNGAGDAYQAPPALKYESSDGTLWYSKYLDDVRADGTAWYNPETGKGCMITNVAANIVEDSQQRLWLTAGRTLFVLVLTP